MYAGIAIDEGERGNESTRNLGRIPPSPSTYTCTYTYTYTYTFDLTFAF